MKEKSRKPSQTPRRKGRAKRRMVLWGSALAGLGLVALLIVQFSAPSPKTPNESKTANPIPPVQVEREWVKGNPEARLVLVEYSDFQCPACGAYYPVVKRLMAEFDGDILLVYRHFPLRRVHRFADLAARAAEAAGRQGKFWEMHDMIFEHQKDWSAQLSVKNAFVDYARQLGLDAEAFENALEADAVKDAVEEDLVGGQIAGVPGTPTFFLNGEMIVNPRGYAAFDRVIRSALEGPSQEPS